MASLLRNVFSLTSRTRFTSTRPSPSSRTTPTAWRSPSASSISSTPSAASSWLLSRPFSSTPLSQGLVRKPTKIKLKTHKGAAKRWFAIANGNFKRSQAGKGVLSPTRLNRLGKPAFARPIEKKKLRRLMPYA
ncbi:BZ3500_MvSof-1268-A1-R1_Chr1-3g01597 [Microbotryum saponariae]|uniref:BZ3500_MvSof-1268-A1-R1_Chr1-3g01597 protein n=1 Tax=Microbotryum saponariae TaxID=289078 RepID=A0A2X0MQC4_9BASI|nr:BZ3500_MvSof-1268-A1-R1_Chr1-3g01597 [Microbotryum saponariae]SCZ94105.1 BZ3501_MvSof-1269-A2-R1_Chr1-3g01198 [Microbotryum saponariae]